MSIKNEIVNVLFSVPKLITQKERVAFIESCGLDVEIVRQIDFSGSIDEFINLLVPQLIEYGNLRDTEKPTIVAVLESVSERVGEVGRRECLKLVAEFKEHTSTGFPVVDKQDVGISQEDYLNTIKSVVGQIQLSQISTGIISNMPLESIYVALPSNYCLSIEIQNFQIVNWWISSDNLDKENLDTTISKDKLHERNEYQIDPKPIEKIVANTQNLITAENGIVSDEEKNRSLILKPLWSDGIVQNVQTINLADFADIVSRTVVVGTAGSGKSTFAKFMALKACNQILKRVVETETARNQYSVPIYIELRDLFALDIFEDPEKEVKIDHLWRYIKENILAPKFQYENELWNQLISGNSILILDGLDEIPTPLDEKNGATKRYDQIKKLISSITTRFPKIKVVLTSRPYVFNEFSEFLTREGFYRVDIGKLDKKTSFRLVNKLYISSGLETALAYSHTQNLLYELKDVSSFLKDRPLFLTLMAIIYYRREDKGLPNERSALFFESINLLLDGWTKARIHIASGIKVSEASTESLFQKIEVIAFHNQANTLVSSYELRDIDVGEIARELLDFYNVREIIDFLLYQSGIFFESGDRKFKFSHRTFQEFLSASYLIRTAEYRKIFELIEARPNVWRETSSFFGDLAGDKVWKLLETVLSFEEDRGKFVKENLNSIWLASKVILDRKLYNEKVSNLTSRYILEEISKLQVIALDEPQLNKLSVEERVDIAVSLGFVGDSRIGVGVVDQLPDIFWCGISGGEFEMGTSKDHSEKILSMDWAAGWDFNYEDSRESPSFPVEVVEFLISRYPITKMQYEVFVSAADGYHNEEWWPNEGWIFHTDGGLEPLTSDIEPGNLPQTNVSWYEAVAFCNWLSSKLGKSISLPTEVQWEWAAKRGGSRIFPWGDEVNSNLANIALSNINTVVPVGIFQNTNNPWGIEGPVDMCGNVWDWCTTICESNQGIKYSFPYEVDDGREDMEAGEEFLRIVRGGSYTNVPLLARSSFRGRDKPSLRRKRQGFRIVCNL